MARKARGKRAAGDSGAVSVRGKVANGEGSLYQEPNGRWRATYRVPGGELKCLVVGELRALLFRSVVGASRGSRPAAHRAVIEPLWIRYLTVRTSFPIVMLIE